MLIQLPWGIWEEHILFSLNKGKEPKGIYVIYKTLLENEVATHFVLARGFYHWMKLSYRKGDAMKVEYLLRNSTQGKERKGSRLMNLEGGVSSKKTKESGVLSCHVYIPLCNMFILVHVSRL